MILLDTDTLLRHSVDEVFSRDAPAAVRRHATGKYLDEEDFDIDTAFDTRDRKQRGGINAGFVLLTPSLKDLARMQWQLRSGQVQGKIPFQGGPEQDFLTRFFANEWTAVGVQWNFQLHQLAFCSRPGHFDSPRMILDFKEDVHVVHFSGSLSCAEFLLRDEYDGTAFRDFVEKHIESRYLQILDRQKRNEFTEDVEKHIKKITALATEEWYDQWQKLAKEHKWIHSMVDKAREKSNNDRDEFELIEQTWAQKLFVGGLSQNVSTEILKQHFTRHGPVHECIAMEEKNGRAKGFGFVTFCEQQAAESCLKEPQVLDGRTLDVAWARKGDSESGRWVYMEFPQLG